MTPEQRLFDIWFYLDERLRTMMADSECCAAMGIKEPDENRVRARIYRGFLHQWFDDEVFTSCLASLVVPEPHLHEKQTHHSD